MKIIIVEHRAHYSGASSQRLLGFAKAFVNKGHEVVMIISPQTPFPKDLGRIKVVEIEETRKHILRCYLQFIKAIKKEYDRDSIIYFYEPQVYAFLFRYPRYNVFADQTEIPNYGLKASTIHKMIEKIREYSYKHFGGISVISKGLKDFYYNKGVKNIEVINMFVDSTRFMNVHKDSNEKYIAYCGTISVHKDGVDTLIRSFKIFSEIHSDYKLYLIGQFDLEGSDFVLKKLVSDLGLDGSVLFTGRINANDLPKVLTGARIMALARPDTIQAKYGFPTKLGEYLATGNPVVVTRVGEIPLYLTDGKNAFLAEPDSVESFAAKLLEVEENYEKSLQIGANGNKLVHSEFSNEVQGEKLLHFFNAVINKE